MIRYKRRLVDAHASPTQRTALAEHWNLHACDILAPDFAEALERFLADAQRPMVILEGVLGYFGPAHQRQLIRSLSSALRGRGGAVADVRVRFGSRSSTGLLRSVILVATRGRGAAPDFKNLDAVRALFAQAGFAGLEALEDLLPDVLSCVVRTPVGEA